MSTLTASQACYRCTVASWRKRHPEKLLDDLRGLAMYNPVLGSAFTCNEIQEHCDPNSGEPFLLGTKVHLESYNGDTLPEPGEGWKYTMAWFNSETTYLLFGWPDPWIAESDGETSEFDPETD